MTEKISARSKEVEKKGNGIDVVLKKEKVSKTIDSTDTKLDTLKNNIQSEKKADEFMRDPDSEDIKLDETSVDKKNEDIKDKPKKKNIWDKVDKFLDKISGVFNHPKGLIAGVMSLLKSFKETSLEEDDSTGRDLSESKIDSLVDENPNLSFLRGDDYMNINYIRNSADKLNPKERRLLGYDFNALSDHRDYPDGREGRRCCALYVSKMLGLSKPYRRVRDILALLVKKNMERTGKSGMVFGYKNMRKGDVCFFRGNKKYAEGRYGHIAIVRHDPFYVNGVKCIAISQDGADIQCNIIPVDDADNSKIGKVKAFVDNPKLRNTIPELKEMFHYRRNYPETVKVSYNRRWYGDASQNGGTIAFAVRTRGIMKSDNSTNFYS